MRTIVRSAGALAVRRSTLQAHHGAKRYFSSSQSVRAVWGFVGLGQMGYPMVKNLRAKLPPSDQVIVHDINTEATANLLKEVGDLGVKIAANAREVAEQSETIITVLPEPRHVEGVYKAMLEPPNLLRAGVAKERLFIDCSTIDPMTSSTVGDACRSAGQGKFVDAPMSGGVVGARAGTLTFMIGAPKEEVERATEILSMMGKRVLHLGPPTSGLKGKLANNYLLALNNIATAEAMNMGVKWGLDAKALAGMINISTGKCWPSEVNNPVPGVVEGAPSGRGYEGGFGISLMKKDLKLALKACQEHGVKLGLGDEAAKIYDQVEAHPDCKGRDFSVVYRYLGGKE